MQRGSLTKFFNKRKRVWVWRFQWREKGYKGPRTRDLGRCSDVSRAEARKLADIILEQVQGLTARPRSSTLTLRRFVEDDYLDVKTRKWKASTRGTTEQLIEDHILTPLGDRMVHSIGRRELQTLLDRLAAAGKSGSIVKHVRWQLSAIFEMARGDGLITVDPTEGLENPCCKPEGEKRVLARELFLRAEMCLAIRERLILRLGAVEGLRPGEIIGLKCGDISADGLRIERRIYRRVVDTPKSKLGQRLVPPSEDTWAVLNEFLNIIPDNSPGAWPFASENPSQPLDYSNVFRHRIRPALKKAGLAWVNFQALRRTHATNMKEVEKDAKVRAQIMGHSVDVHENEYRQVPLKAKQRAMKRLGRHLQ